MLPDKKISHLQSELPSWIEHWTRQLNERLTTRDSLLIAIAYFDLAHGILANDEVDVARKLFQDGANALISGGCVRSDIHIDIYGNGHKFPIYGYLGGGYNLGKPIAERYFEDFRAEMEKPGYLSPSQRIYEHFYLVLGLLVLEDVKEITTLIDSLNKRLLKFKIKDSLYQPSGLYYKYPLFGKEIVKALFEGDNQQFSKNVFHWSQLMLNAISVHDAPSVLAEIELIFLYDLALRKGMRPKLDTPFIPKSILKNGYWNKP